MSSKLSNEDTPGHFSRHEPAKCLGAVPTLVGFRSLGAFIPVATCKVLGRRFVSPETRRKLSEAGRGRQVSLETRMKLSIAHRGKHPSTEFAIGNKIWLGRHHTLESRRKISEKLKGRKLPEWHIAKISAGHRGLVPWNKGLTRDTSPSLARSGEASRLRWTRERREWLSRWNKQWVKKWWQQHPEAKERLLRTNRPTRIELMARASLERRGIQFLTNKAVEGICFPDFVLRDKKIAVFCNGCFWHGCNVHCPEIPLWLRLRTRDKEIYRKLEALGWRVLVAWEHEFKVNPDVVGQRLDEILHAG